MNESKSLIDSLYFRFHNTGSISYSGSRNERINKQIDKWLVWHGINARMNEWMYEWVNEQMEKLMDE